MDDQQTLEIDEVLDQLISYCVDEAKKRIEEDGVFAPFTVIADSENVYEENYPTDEAREEAMANVRAASAFAQHYALCYDGYLDTDQGQLDAVIVEAASKDSEVAYVLALIYTSDDGKYSFEQQLAYLDDTENFLVLPADEADDEVEEA